MLNNYKVNEIISEIKIKKRKNSFKSCEIPKFIFICGSSIMNDSEVDYGKLNNDQNKRGYLINSLEKIQSTIAGVSTKPIHNVRCMISEIIWDYECGMDTMTFEELLAELSDEIIIIVESPGTVCELGAFSCGTDFIKKLTVINNKQYEHNNSFINNGPIKKIFDINDTAVNYIPYEINKFKNDFLVKKIIKDISLKQITYTPNKNNRKLDLKNLIYELLNIIELFQPLTKTELVRLFLYLKDFTKYEIINGSIWRLSTISKVIDLMVKMKIINIKNELILCDSTISCYNSMFNIDRSEFNKYRFTYLSAIYKKYPERMIMCNNGNRNIN